MPLLTFTTDFGSKDFRLARLKAIMSNELSSDVRFVDISHDSRPYDIVEAAFIFESTFKHFPTGSVHIIYVYPNSNQTFLLAKYKKHFIIAPDNGLLPMICYEDSCDYFSIQNTGQRQVAQLQAIARLVQNCFEGTLEILPISLNAVQKRIALQPIIKRNEIRTSVIYIDRYGNVYFNLKKEAFEKSRNNRSFKIFYKGMEPIEQIHSHYDDVDESEILCMFNEIGYLLLAQNMGSAQEALGLNPHENIQILFYD